MKRAFFAITILFTTITLSIGCQRSSSTSQNSSGLSDETVGKPQSKSNELDRPTALALVKEKVKIPIVMSAWQDNNTRGEYIKYQPLVQAGILSCQERYGTYDGATKQPILASFEYYQCQPGTNSVGMAVEKGRVFLILGYKVPSEITGISKVSQSNADADIVVSFERSEGSNLYERYKQEFDGLFSKEQNSNNEQYTARFKLYDDGWRVVDIFKP